MAHAYLADAKPRPNLKRACTHTHICTLREQTDRICIYKNVDASKPRINKTSQPCEH